jgi:hypothetical protein
MDKFKEQIVVAFCRSLRDKEIPRMRAIANLTRRPREEIIQGNKIEVVPGNLHEARVWCRVNGCVIAISDIVERNDEFALGLLYAALTWLDERKDKINGGR